MPARAGSVLLVAIASAAVFLAARAGLADRNETVTGFKRLSSASAEELGRQLADIPVVGLGDSAPAILAAYIARMQEEAGLQAPHALVDALPLLEARPDLRTLPLRRGDYSKLTARAAATLETLSRKLRVYLDQQAPINKKGERPELPKLRTVLRGEVRAHRPEWLQAEAIPTLLQLLSHEDKPVRQMLVELLDAIPGRASTTALARRAVFDLDPEVRAAAVSALRNRPLPVSRGVLVEFLRYPWPPAAEHAAEALVNLHDRGAVGQLVAALNDPDPATAQPDGKGGSIVRELVRVHHLTNCMLCHPPATTGADPVLGTDPVLRLSNSQRSLAPTVQRLQSTPGAHNYGSGSQSAPALLRADVTYLRQDFSVLQALPPAVASSLQNRSGPLAAPMQRFDFVVRKRPVSKKETDLLRTTTSRRSESPQHAATLFALRQITGRDAGSSYTDWLKHYPDAGDEVEAARLSKSLIQARGDRREQLLTQYRTEKGVTYTLALAAAIPALDGHFQEQVRNALGQRLERMTASTLRERLREEEPELRRAAAVALGGKGDETAVPELIEVLGDSEPEVAEAARTGLQALTRQSFATNREWRQWWQDRSRDGRPN